MIRSLDFRVSGDEFQIFRKFRKFDSNFSKKFDKSPGFFKFLEKFLCKFYTKADSYQFLSHFRLSQASFISEIWLIFADFSAFLSFLAYRFQICRILEL